MGLNITVMSYCGKLDFGIIADREHVPDVWKLIEWLRDALEELKPAPPKAKRAKPARKNGKAARKDGKPALEGPSAVGATVESEEREDG
jgi:hypothetical protein